MIDPSKVVGGVSAYFKTRHCINHCKTGHITDLDIKAGNNTLNEKNCRIGFVLIHKQTKKKGCVDTERKSKIIKKKEN